MAKWEVDYLLIAGAGDVRPARCRVYNRIIRRNLGQRRVRFYARDIGELIRVLAKAWIRRSTLCPAT